MNKTAATLISELEKTASELEAMAENLSPEQAAKVASDQTTQAMSAYLGGISKALGFDNA